MRYEVDIENDDELVRDWLVEHRDNPYTPHEIRDAIDMLLAYVTSQEEFDKLTVDNPLCRV